MINLSVTAPFNPVINQAVEAAFKNNIPVIAAAGNLGDLATRYSPGRTPEGTVQLVCQCTTQAAAVYFDTVRQLRGSHGHDK